MLKGYIFKEQTFNNEVCALIFNEYLNNSDGVFGNYKNGMAVTKSGSNVTIANGIGIIKGRAVGEDSSTTLDAGTTEMYCKLVIEIDLDKVNTSSSFLQASYKILKSSSAYPSLTQDNIIGTNSGVYQYELARFRTTANGITDFQDMRTFIDIPTMYEQIVQMVQDAIDSIEDGSAFMLKPETLFEGATNIRENPITLSDDKENYDDIEIFYRRDGEGAENSPCKSLKISADQTYAQLDMIYATGHETIYLQFTSVIVKIQGDKITYKRGAMYGINTGGSIPQSGQEYSYIVEKVLGYKYGRQVNNNAE